MSQVIGRASRPAIRARRVISILSSSECGAGAGIAPRPGRLGSALDGHPGVCTLLEVGAGDVRATIDALLDRRGPEPHLLEVLLVRGVVVVAVLLRLIAGLAERGVGRS